MPERLLVSTVTGSCRVGVSRPPSPPEESETLLSPSAAADGGPDNAEEAAEEQGTPAVLPQQSTSPERQIEVAEQQQFTGLLVLTGCTVAFVTIVTIGSRTIATVGSKITKLTQSSAFVVQAGATMAVLLSTTIGLPVSTSHCLVGALIGTGIAGKYAAPA